jgi:hypothetical protein
VAVFEFDTEHRIRERFNDLPPDFDYIIFRHPVPSPFRFPEHAFGHR